jgi:pyruvate/2-oxoglutarate dehydrogenase complex dihydrolipoamide dehydrogenase (E3) component
VSIIERLQKIADDMEPINRVGIMELFEKEKVNLLTGREAIEFTEAGVVVLDPQTGEKEIIKADRIVIAVGTKPVDTMEEALKSQVKEFYSVGDCNRPRVIMEAIYEGSLVGRQI